MKHFQFSTISIDNSPSGCHCCDICAKKCSCENCYTWNLHIETLVKSDQMKERVVSDEDKTEIRKKLQSYSAILKPDDAGKISVVSVPNIYLVFDDIQINQVLQSCHKLFNRPQLLMFVEIWREVHANDIIVVLDETFGDIETDTSDLQLTEWTDNIATSTCTQWKDDAELSSFFLGDSARASCIDSITERMDISADED